VTAFLDTEDLLFIAGQAVGSEVLVRDIGLLESSAARPQATVMGVDAYPDLWTKAAALLHSLARNHALVDGNKRLAWAATVVFLAINGHRIEVDRTAGFNLVMAVASGQLDDVQKISVRLQDIIRGFID
jgi:death on curing protein